MSTAQASEGTTFERHPPRHARAERAGDRALPNRTPTPRAIATALVPATVLMLAFAFFYVGAFHNPTPHHVPVAVIGPPAVATDLNRLPGGPLDARQAVSRSDALLQIRDRDVYGAYEAATNQLLITSAASRATAIALEETFNRIDAAQHRRAIQVIDVKPLPASDPNGTSAFYAVVAWMFGGYIASTLIGLIAAPRSSSRRRAAARVGALAGFAVLTGILSVLILRASFGVFSGHVVALCGIAVLTIFASGAATAGIQAAAGPAGTALVILIFVILGNSASGGPFARPLLPGLWRTIGGVLPPGASVDLARSALYFDGAAVKGPIVVLMVWAVVGTALALAVGGRITDPAETEAEAAAGAAV